MNPRSGAVAIVGIGCRFPGGVDDPASFWRLLSEGVDAITRSRADRIDLDHFYDPRPATPGRMMTRWGGFLDGIDEFDADFFGISPREAERLDPQQRLLLETAWEALEDAGQDIGRTGGHARPACSSASGSATSRPACSPTPTASTSTMTPAAGATPRPAASPTALGLRGPSLTLDTACSSSLVAVHLAVPQPPQRRERRWRWPAA